MNFSWKHILLTTKSHIVQGDKSTRGHRLCWDQNESCVKYLKYPPVWPYGANLIFKSTKSVSPSTFVTLYLAVIKFPMSPMADLRYQWGHPRVIPVDGLGDGGAMKKKIVCNCGVDKPFLMYFGCMNLAPRWRLLWRCINNPSQV